MKFGWSRLEHDIISQLKIFASCLNALKRILFVNHKIKASREVVVYKSLRRFWIGNFRKPLSMAFSMNARGISDRFFNVADSR
jgi:hypothetical protein